MRRQVAQIVKEHEAGDAVISVLEYQDVAAGLVSSRI
jgi:hypothetical protein